MGLETSKVLLVKKKKKINKTKKARENIVKVLKQNNKTTCEHRQQKPLPFSPMNASPPNNRKVKISFPVIHV